MLDFAYVKPNIDRLEWIRRRGQSAYSMSSSACLRLGAKWNGGKAPDIPPRVRRLEQKPLSGNCAPISACRTSATQRRPAGSARMPGFVKVSGGEGMSAGWRIRSDFAQSKRASQRAALSKSVGDQYDRRIRGVPNGHVRGRCSITMAKTCDWGAKPATLANSAIWHVGCWPISAPSHRACPSWMVGCGITVWGWHPSWSGIAGSSPRRPPRIAGRPHWSPAITPDRFLLVLNAR